MELEIPLENLSLEEKIEKVLIKVLVVDIGIKHLGLCLAFVDKEYIIDHIVDINLIDITIYTHNNCKKEDCKLYHTKTAWDWLEHVFVEHPCFEQSDIILIERQPITGITSVEQIIFGKYRHKAELINPCNVHRFLNIKHLNYEQRKEFCVNFGIKYLDEKQQEELKNYERMHDICDCIEMLVYWTNKKYTEKIKQDEIDRQHVVYKDVLEKIDSFRYKPRCINLKELYKL